MDESVGKIIDFYKLKEVNSDNLEIYHPLDGHHVYVAVDATDANDDDHKIMLNKVELMEFAKHGLTGNLKKKIKIIED